MAKSESMAKSCSNKCIHSGICFDKGVVNALTKWIAAMLGMLHSQLLIVPLINNFIFRSFSPSPMQMEFKPGQSYYFISTSSDRDIHRRVGGWCSTKNMKMIFRWVYIILSNRS